MNAEVKFISINIAVVTISDTRDFNDDKSGETLVKRISNFGHKISVREIVKDDFDAIRKKLGQLSGGNSKRRVMWRPPQDETTTVRLIAFTDNNGNPFKERYFYYNIGNNPGLLSLIHI